MSLLDPKERSARGAERQAALLAAPAPEPRTPVEESWRDFIFAEIWTRPGLDLRSRYIIGMAGAADVKDLAMTEAYVRGALSGGELTVAELREAALHLAVYGGWSSGQVLDEAVTRAADALGLPLAACPPIRAEPWDPMVRRKEGGEGFAFHMKFPSPSPDNAYQDAGILNFVFGEMWSRPGLDQRSRRWITLVGVGNSSSSTPIRSHVWSAMASGNATRAEMDEFVLQYGVHAGWPRASVMQGAVREQAPRAEQGLPFVI